LNRRRETRKNPFVEAENGRDGINE
jgi:hypothetical protein